MKSKKALEFLSDEMSSNIFLSFEVLLGFRVIIDSYKHRCSMAKSNKEIVQKICLDLFNVTQIRDLIDSGEIVLHADHLGMSIYAKETPADDFCSHWMSTIPVEMLKAIDIIMVAHTIAMLVKTYTTGKEAGIIAGKRMKIAEIKAVLMD
jgi:hypothetical protein